MLRHNNHNMPTLPRTFLVKMRAGEQVENFAGFPPQSATKVAWYKSKFIFCLTEAGRATVNVITTQGMVLDGETLSVSKIVEKAVEKEYPQSWEQTG